MQISTTLQETVKEFQHFKVLKMVQNLHANMEGFCRSGHILQSVYKMNGPLVARNIATVWFYMYNYYTKINFKCSQHEMFFFQNLITYCNTAICIIIVIQYSLHNMVLTHMVLSLISYNMHMMIT